jgi:hypothetical protein
MKPLTAAQQVIAKHMSEDELESNVKAMCRTLDLAYYHTRNSRQSVEGFPDDVIVGTAVLYRELKRSGKNPSARQQGWLDRLGAAGQDVGVWRPEDWLSGRVEDELRAVSTRQ